MAVSSTSNDVTSKTASDNTQVQPVIEYNPITNVLHNYRSFTYNFTLFCLGSEDVGNSEKYTTSDPEFVILKSGGRPLPKVDLTAGVTSEELPVKDVFDKFLEHSSGRFDMFIERVEFDSVVAPNEIGGLTLSRLFSFDVVEPYSINGFIESLQVAALKAGYINYLGACFVLRMQFIGYPDNVDIPSPEVIPKTTRCFSIRFTGMEVEITEKGMRYRCKAVAWNDMGLGQSNVLKAPLSASTNRISMKGDTVQSILDNLMDSLNQQLLEDSKQYRADDKKKDADTYSIVFPSRKETEVGLDYESVSPIGKSKVIEINRDDRLFSFDDPQTTNKANAYKISNNSSGEKSNNADNSSQVQYREGQKLHEIITAIIRDSEYCREIFKNLEKSIDANGMVDYFLINVEVTNRGIDSVSRKPFQNFKYVVVPYKVHFSNIPTMLGRQVDYSKYKGIIYKNYDYIYTGNNLDVLNFKINLNFLYFEAIAKNLGNTDIPNRLNTDPNNKVPPLKEKADNVKSLAKNQGVVVTQQVSESQTAVQPPGGTGGQLQTDPLLSMSRAFYSAVIDSNTAVKGDLEILGDPFFLVQGGVGQYKPKRDPAYANVFQDGDIDYMAQQVLIRINFKNPTDIQELSKGGTLNFDPDRVPFSGVYRVLSIRSSFVDGMFKQILTILRMPGQIQSNETESKPADKLVTTN